MKRILFVFSVIAGFSASVIAMNDLDGAQEKKVYSKSQIFGWWNEIKVVYIQMVFPVGDLSPIQILHQKKFTIINNWFSSLKGQKKDYITEKVVREIFANLGAIVNPSLLAYEIKQFQPIESQNVKPESLISEGPQLELSQKSPKISPFPEKNPTKESLWQKNLIWFVTGGFGLTAAAIVYYAWKKYKKNERQDSQEQSASSTVF